MLKGNQKKLDKNKNNRIDAEDFKLLRDGKRMGGVMKAKRGKLTFDEKFKMQERGLTDKKTGKLIPPHERALKDLKTSEVKKMAKTGLNPKLETPKPGKFLSQSMIDKNKKTTKLEARSFLERRGITDRALRAAKATRVGKIAAGVAGAGLAAKAFLDKKRKEAQEKKKNKKMGGGMMKRPGYKKGKAIMIIAIGKPKKKMGGGLAAATERLKAQGKMGGGMMKKYNKGGGADMGSSRMKAKAVTEKSLYTLAQSMKDKDRLTQRDIENAKKAKDKDRLTQRDMQGFTSRVSMPKKKMGGGMMKPEKALLGKFLRRKKKATPGMKMVESSPGGFGLLGRLAKKVGLSQGGGADTGKVGEMKSRATVGLGRIERQRENLKKRIKGTPTFKKLVDKKMGGGMMQPAMPMYKKGTMIKARGGGIAKTKPTKMY